MPSRSVQGDEGPPTERRYSLRLFQPRLGRIQRTKVLQMPQRRLRCSPFVQHQPGRFHPRFVASYTRFSTWIAFPSCVVCRTRSFPYQSLDTHAATAVQVSFQLVLTDASASSMAMQASPHARFLHRTPCCVHVARTCCSSPSRQTIRPVRPTSLSGSIGRDVSNRKETRSPM